MHFCVLAIHPDSMPIEEVMRPYDENLPVYAAKDGDYLYHYNPNGKWDWFEVGGRWKGSLKLYNGQSVDSALVKDVDMSFNLNDYNTALKYWDDVMSDKISPVLSSKERLLQDYFSRDNYAALQAMFHFAYVIDYCGNWNEIETSYLSATLPERIQWAQSFQRKFIRPVLSKGNEYRITVVDIHI